MRGRAIVGVLVSAVVSGCDSAPCVEMLSAPEKALHALPGMLVAYAVAWAGLDAARFVLRAPETGAGRVAGICALGVGTVGLAGVVPDFFPLLLGVLVVCLLPMAWVGRMVRATSERSVWRTAGALACTAATGVFLCGLAAANVALVTGAGRVCAPSAVSAPSVAPADIRSQQ
ncbi:MAG: hypothetical protein ACRBN8_27465 [Nannocystales bacterium]